MKEGSIFSEIKPKNNMPRNLKEKQVKFDETLKKNSNLFMETNEIAQTYQK